MKTGVMMTKLKTLIAMQVPRENISGSATHFAQSIGDSSSLFRVDQFGDLPVEEGKLAITFTGSIVAPPLSVNEAAEDIQSPVTRAELMAEYDRIESGSQSDHFVIKLPESVKKTLYVCVYIGSEYPSLFGKLSVIEHDAGITSPEKYKTIKTIDVEIPLSGTVDLRSGLIEALENKREKLKADYYIADKKIADQIGQLQALENK